MNTNPELERLIELLDKAEKLASEFVGGYSNNFFSAEEFHLGLVKSINQLRKGDKNQLNNLALWFAPTCDWDDFIQQDGLDLANEIFPIICELRKQYQIISITDLITDYLEKVEHVISAFRLKYNRNDLLVAWRSDKVIPQVGELTSYHIKRYAFHGIGLEVEFDDNTSVNFDFAFLPEQRHDGFDLWRLGQFVSSNQNKYAKYLDKSILETEFNNLIERNLIIKPEISPSTTLYFFKSSLTKQILETNSSNRSWWKLW